MESLQIDIITILKAYINRDYSFNISSKYEDLCRKSTNYTLGPVVGYTLNKSQEHKNNIFDSVVYNAAIRYEKQEKYRQYVSKLLTENGIDFVFLKGITYAKHYDEPYLRISTDIDILVSNKDFDKAKEIIINKGKFKLFAAAGNEITLRKNGIDIDLQRTLTNDVEVDEKMFDEIDLSSSNHELSNEYKYIHLISHTAKHLRESYIGLQFILDLYYLNQLKLDKEFINNKLKIAGLNKFNEINLEMIDVLFNNKKSNDVVDKYIEFIFNLSEDLENMVLVGNANNNYLLRRIFPKYKTMLRMYPKVENKLLLPIYYVKRIFDRISEGRSKKALVEINTNRHIDNNKVKEVKELYKNIGL